MDPFQLETMLVRGRIPRQQPRADSRENEFQLNKTRQCNP